MRADKKEKATRAMPEYQMFPRGMWHMLAAVMLMIPVLASLVGAVSDFFAYATGESTVVVLDMVVLALLALILGVPTVLISRGYARAQNFLIGLSLVQALISALAAFVYLMAGKDVAAGLSFTGLMFALAALKLYRSKGLAEYVVYARDVWSVHRPRG